jgi:hypothetical protein
MPATMLTSPPPNRRAPDALGDPTRYRTIPGIPLLDTHEPIRKRVNDPKAVTRDNPYGITEAMLTCDENDLEAIARNANASVAAGRPPAIQIGHTPEEDRPEVYWPKPVGRLTNHRVCRVNGKPWLCADMHFRVDRLDEVSDYPNLSVERIGMDEPGEQSIRSVALLRRRPERDVPLVPYAAEPTTKLSVCYSREVPAPVRGPQGAGVGSFEKTYADGMKSSMSADEMNRFLHFALRRGLNHRAISTHQSWLISEQARKVRPISPTAPDRSEVLAYATVKGISVFELARRKLMFERNQGKV